MVFSPSVHRIREALINLTRRHCRSHNSVVSQSGSDNFGPRISTGSAVHSEKKKSIRITISSLDDLYYGIWGEGCFHNMFSKRKVWINPFRNISLFCRLRERKFTLFFFFIRLFLTHLNGTIASFVSPESARFMLISVITQCVFQVNSLTVLFHVKLPSSLGSTSLKCNWKTLNSFFCIRLVFIYTDQRHWSSVALTRCYADNSICFIF